MTSPPVYIETTRSPPHLDPAQGGNNTVGPDCTNSGERKRCSRGKNILRFSHMAYVPSRLDQATGEQHLWPQIVMNGSERRAELL